MQRSSGGRVCRRKMGCFFSCFRIRDSKANVVTPKEPVAPCSNNALSSLFVTDDRSLGKVEEGQNQLPGELDVGELKDEQAKFLKACGTSPETPVKIKKALEKWESISAPNEAEISSNFDTCASIEKPKFKNRSDESPKPVKICEERVNGSGSLLDSPSSCVTYGHNTERASGSSIQRSVHNVNTPMVMCDGEARSKISSVSTRVDATSAQCEKKSARFDCEPDRFSLSSKGSSFECVSPTPLRNELKDESSDSHLPSDSVKLNDEDDLTSTPVSKLSVREEMKNEASLSSWLKPLSAKEDDNKKSEDVYRRNIPVDRPILGMVAAHWNDEETSHISPKWWDGNGIPNSTNKYKEDQKVSWHATPFEERLEKALSEETLISQRKPTNRAFPVGLNETVESDTASSHLRSSTQFKSVVSF